MPTTFEHVPCTVCGCVCDDLSVTVEAGRITRADRACDLARPRFFEQNSTSPPTAEISAEIDEFTQVARRAVTHRCVGMRQVQALRLHEHPMDS